MSRICLRCSFFLFLLASGLVLVTACRPRPQSSSTAPSGRIAISGAWALYPLVVQWAEAYQEEFPAVRVDVSAGGAGKGIADALARLVDLGMVSREITPAETNNGCVFVPVAKDAVVCIINAANPLARHVLATGLARPVLTSIWLATSLTTWGAVAQTNSTAPLHVYTRSDAAGAPETWAAYLGARQENLKGDGVYGDPGVVQAVRTDINGIGYCNLNFGFDPATDAAVAGIVVVPLDANANGRADASEAVATRTAAMQAIRTGNYPSPPARDLYLVTKESFQGTAAHFVRWALTVGQRYVDRAGYICVSSNQIAHAMQLVP